MGDNATMIAPRISANPSFCAILPREAEDKFKDFNHPDAVIGTGPFVLKSYEKGVRVVYAWLDK